MQRLSPAAMVALLVAAPAPAQVVTITTIADFSTVAPGGTATFTGFGASTSARPVIAGSAVVFTGQVGNSYGIYSSVGGVISTVVPPAAPIPNGTGNFTSYGGVGYNGGTLIFNGTGNGQDGIYALGSGTISRLVDLNSAVPGGTGTFMSLGGTSFSNGTLAFGGQWGQSQSGVYVSTGGTPPFVSVIADPSNAIPGQGGTTFQGLYFGATAISGQTVVFQGGNGSGNGLYQRVGSGPITTIADKNTPLPSGSGNFASSFWDSLSVSGANVAFVNGTSGPDALYALIHGSIRTIADPSTPSPNGTGNFTGLSANGSSNVAIDGNQIAFVGYTATSQGVYLYDGSALHTLIDNTNPIFDGQVLNFREPFSFGPDAISGNQVVFTAFFGNTGVDSAVPTSFGIYEATFTPVPEPSAFALVGVAMLSLARRLRRKG